MKEKFLPIGTVVTLKGGTVKLMIIGFCVTSPDHEGIMFDYSALPYPIGEVADGTRAMFNHDQIETINHMGYESEEDIEFKQQINLFLEIGKQELEILLAKQKEEMNN